MDEDSILVTLGISPDDFAPPPQQAWDTAVGGMFSGAGTADAASVPVMDDEPAVPADDHDDALTAHAALDHDAGAHHDSAPTVTDGPAVPGDLHMEFGGEQQPGHDDLAGHDLGGHDLGDHDVDTFHDHPDFGSEHDPGHAMDV